MNSHRIGDRLAALRRARFVGRGAELELFRSALRAAEPPFAVLHVYGPGGVGKTTLLREYARLAAESGRPVVQLDGRNVDPSPPGFLRGLRLDRGPDEAELPADARDWPPAAVLLIDTYETLAPLDPWLRELFLPRLPAGSLVVTAGRNPPAQAWRTDAGWAELARSLPLGNLRPAESRTYLTARGVPGDQLAGALAFTHGHPLALALVADVLRRGDGPAAFDPAGAPDVVRALLERLVHDEPSLERRTALEVCVLTTPGHEGKAYSLSGPRALSYDEAACILSGVLGREVRYVPVPDDVARCAMIAGGAPELYADTVIDLNRYFRDGGAAGASGDVAQVTGREPISFEQFVRDHAVALAAPVALAA